MTREVSWQNSVVFALLHFCSPLRYLSGCPDGSEGKESVYNAGDPGSIPGPGRYPGEGNGNPLQNFCLENPIDRGAWWIPLHGVAKSCTGLSN